MSRILILVAVGAAILAFVWLARRPRRLFEVRVLEDRVDIRGAVPNREQRELRAFLSDLRLPVGARIRAMSDGRSDFRLKFSPSVRSEDRDAVRTYLRDPGPRFN